MKVIKKVIKIVAILGALCGFAKLVCEFCKTTIKMNGYNQKSVFTGTEVDYEDEHFENDSVASLFSGVELNFEKATMKDKTSMLEIFGRFSGIEVTVPKHWKVNLDGIQKSSGISNTVKEIEDEQAPVLNINYDLAFCGLEVTNPREKTEDELFEEEVIEEVIEAINKDESTEPEELVEEDLEIKDIEEDTL